MSSFLRRTVQQPQQDTSIAVLETVLGRHGGIQYGIADDWDRI